MFNIDVPYLTEARTKPGAEAPERQDQDQDQDQEGNQDDSGGAA